MSLVRQFGNGYPCYVLLSVFNVLYLDSSTKEFDQRRIRFGATFITIDMNRKCICPVIIDKAVDSHNLTSAQHPTTGKVSFCTSTFNFFLSCEFFRLLLEFYIFLDY